MAISSFKQIIENCYEGGQYWQQYWRKLYPYTTYAGTAVDLSMSTGNPRPNYYVGDQFTATRFNGNYGIFHGGDVAEGQKKYIHKLNINATATAYGNSAFIVCDYLLFYPLIDGSSTDEQLLTNTVTLPRYTDGLGVQIAVVITNLHSAQADFYLTYVNHLDEEKQSYLCTAHNLSGLGQILHSAISTSNFVGGPFVRIQPGDGVKRVKSITFVSAPGGLFSVVLIKPLVEVFRMTATSPLEWDFITMGSHPIEVKNGAYLNIIQKTWSSISGSELNGSLTTIWN